MSWMAPCDELGDRREPVGLGNSVGSNADAALTFKAGHGRVVNEPLDRAAREREFDAVHRTPLRESLARKPIRGKLFTLEFHCHRDFPASPWCACAQWPQSRPWYHKADIRHDLLFVRFRGEADIQSGFMSTRPSVMGPVM